MAKIALVQTQGGALVPLTDDDKHFIDKKRVGTVLECDFKTLRNPMFHRKYFLTPAKKLTFLIGERNKLA
ncbi:DUF1367 family protein [Photobacterium phosphoreum]|uniref:DUF1367 family protein n=1 Tax=Photobacterium phosphoreum TaxID=659 RepID=UPI001EFD1C8F|nr:DUF1367 family protein [Photobacterium phosphoreum]